MEDSVTSATLVEFLFDISVRSMEIGSLLEVIFLDYGNAPPEEDTIPAAGLMPLYGCVQLSSHNSWSVMFSDMVVCKVMFG